MVRYSLVARLWVTTLLVLCSVVHMDTVAIPQVTPKNGMNEDAIPTTQIIDITTPRVKIDLEKLFDESIMDDDSIESIESTTIKPEFAADSLQNYTEVVIDTTESIESTKMKPELATDSLQNYTEVVTERTSEQTTAEIVNASNIYSLTTLRPILRSKIKMRPTNRNSSTASTSSSNSAVIQRIGRRRQTQQRKPDVSMTERDNNENTTALGSKQIQETKNIANKRTNTKSINELNNVNQISFDEEDTNENANLNSSQKPQSHIYKVNSNYKRYKKLNILPPKPLWRDPNDNSWRNESISSLGIKYKPKMNHTNTTPFKKKDLSEIENLIMEAENSSVPGLRERLGKLSEIRKSKKKLNVSVEMTEEDYYDYIDNVDLQEIYDANKTTSAPTNNSKNNKVSVPSQINNYKEMREKIADSSNYHQTQSTIKQRQRRPYANHTTERIVDTVSDLKYNDDIHPTQTATLANKFSQSKLETVSDLKSYYEDLNLKQNRTYENGVPKSKVQTVSGYKSDFDHTKQKQKEMYAVNPTTSRVVTVSDSEYDYDIEVSKEMLSSSESWGEKKITETVDTTTPNVTVILDSITEYFDPKILTTERTTEAILPRRNSKILEHYVRPEIKSEQNISGDFAKKNVDWPMISSKSDNYPQSYSYNTMPHKEMTVNYNNTVIHKPAPINTSSSNNMAPIEERFVPDVINDGIDEISKAIDEIKNQQELTKIIIPSLDTKIPVRNNLPNIEDIELGIPRINERLFPIGTAKDRFSELPNQSDAPSIISQVNNRPSIPMREEQYIREPHSFNVNLQNPDIILRGTMKPNTVENSFVTRPLIPEKIVMEEPPLNQQFSEKFGSSRNEPYEPNKMMQIMNNIHNVDKTFFQSETPSSYNSTVLHVQNKDSIERVNDYMENTYNGRPESGDIVPFMEAEEMPRDYRMQYMFRVPQYNSVSSHIDSTQVKNSMHN